jgi:hypothetical protein
MWAGFTHLGLSPPGQSWQTLNSLGTGPTSSSQAKRWATCRLIRLLPHQLIETTIPEVTKASSPQPTSVGARLLVNTFPEPIRHISVLGPTLSRTSIPTVCRGLIGWLGEGLTTLWAGALKRARRPASGRAVQPLEARITEIGCPGLKRLSARDTNAIHNRPATATLGLHRKLTPSGATLPACFSKRGSTFVVRPRRPETLGCYLAPSVANRLADSGRGRLNYTVSGKPGRRRTH